MLWFLRNIIKITSLQVKQREAVIWQFLFVSLFMCIHYPVSMLLKNSVEIKIEILSSLSWNILLYTTTKDFYEKEKSILNFQKYCFPNSFLPNLLCLQFPLPFPLPRLQLILEYRDHRVIFNIGIIENYSI